MFVDEELNGEPHNFKNTTEDLICLKRCSNLRLFKEGRNSSCNIMADQWCAQGTMRQGGHHPFLCSLCLKLQFSLSLFSKDIFVVYQDTFRLNYCSNVLPQ